MVSREGIKFKEYLLSGEGNNCAIYGLGFTDRDSAKRSLLENSKTSYVRELIVPEIRADIEESGTASEKIRTSNVYIQLVQEEDAATKALNAEIQTLKKRKNLNGELTDIELKKCFQSNELIAYLEKYTNLTQIKERLRFYLSSEDTFKDFVNNAVADNIQLTYLPGDQGEVQTSIMDALAHIQGKNLCIWGTNDKGRIVKLHEYIGEAFDKTVNLLHTRYQDQCISVKGGVPGTVKQNKWNHFNKLQVTGA